MLPLYKNTKDFKQVLDALEHIKSGNLSQHLVAESTGLYGDLVETVNEVNVGIRKAVDSAMKSERLKSELITNVSHDIRTPLTSIINYVDLLKGEKDESVRGQYLEVLDVKSQRLKVLVEDLFDAAKVSSGNIPITFEEVNLGQLLQQCLGEANEAFDEKKLVTVVECDNGNMLGDRNAMWRIIDNLLTNITKYALEGSRVYIECHDADDKIQLVFKNISKHPLNIPVEELKTRFKRGDDSRHTEGSGLGLSITEDLIRIQKGSMALIIDGDLFKVMIEMPIYQ